MIDTIRKALLLLVLGIIGIAGYYFFENINTSVEMGNIKVKVMKDGVDVEIENFKVTHEVKGVKEWELKADLAQINNATELTQLQNVEMTLHKEDNRKYVISADSGVYKEKTKDVNLSGHVKLVGSAAMLMDRLSSGPSKSDSKSTKENEK
ncbi:MAG: LPS export ABC transporter periplasmic protein LptC [Nitrospinaceae bacterium]|nr:LPS export ABC transporter periplasmic protein LptC [Nitrospinaceae bacterium]MBT6346658.1 LPS export ABC transporter periplasmic protein LptC [Nitrospina sp.]